MSQKYEPPKVWKMKEDVGGKFGSINRPSAGARRERELPQGKHDFQLYSLATPNGVKVTVMFEELLAAGIKEAEYDAYSINIMEGDQFGSGFVDINPNSKIPALVDRSGDRPIHLFESGSILLHLAEKFKMFIPKEASARAETLNWLFWQMGSAPYVGGGLGHFYAYAPEKIEYAIDRFAMETKRQLDVLDKRLADNKYIAGDEYTIADIAIWPWYGTFAMGEMYNAGEFLEVDSYKNLLRWAKDIAARPAVKKGRLVNKAWGEENQQVIERHDDSAFEGKDLG